MPEEKKVIGQIFSIAVQHHQKGNFQEAENLYKKILQADPKHFQSIVNIAVLAKQFKKYDTAKQLFLEALKINPQFAHGYYNFGVLYEELEEYQDAVTCYQKALQINPQYTETHNNLGNVYEALGDHEKAITCYEKALQINPQFANAHHNLGNAWEKIGDSEKAITCYEKALQINPQFADAHHNLGNLWGALGDHKKAISYYEKALQLNPQFSDVYHNLGNLWGKLGDPEKAATCFETALQINPRIAEAHTNLMMIYERTNNLEALKRSIQNAKLQIADNPIIIIYEAHILWRENKIVEAKNLLESVNIEEYKNIKPKIKIKYYELFSKICDHINDTKKAFQYFLKINQYDAKNIQDSKFNKDVILQKIKDNKKYFNSTNINKWNKISIPVNRPAPVFLVGFPRSGTTLLDSILRSHPMIKVIEERPTVTKTTELFLSISKGQIDYLGRISDLHVKKLRTTYYKELDLHLGEIGKGQLFIDKLPLNIIDVGFLHRIFPECKFILAVRHPCDCSLSCFMNRFAVNDAMANFYSLSDTIHFYDEVMNLWKQYVNLLPIHFKMVKYESVVEDLKGSINPLLTFLGLEWNNSLIDFNQTALNRTKINTPSYNQVIKPLYKQAIGRWKRYGNEMRDVLPKLEPWIKEFDYQSLIN